MVEFLLYSEVNIICIVVFGIIAVNTVTSEFNLEIKSKALSAYIWFTILFYILDILGILVKTLTLNIPHIINYVLDASYFLSFANSTYLWFIYSEALHSRPFFSNKKKRFLAITPVIVLFILLFVSYFNGCLFSFDVSGKYQRGPLFFLQALISFSYLIITTLRCAFIYTKTVSPAKKTELLCFSAYTLILIFSGILQFIVISFPILIIGNTLSVLIMYINSLRRMISLDPLTEIPNRRNFMHKLLEETKLIKPDKDLYFMFADVDSFKEINDRYGHDEGDRVLKEFSYLLKSVCSENDCFCCRYGGDEFAVLQLVNKGEDFKLPQTIEEEIIKRQIKINGSTELSVSIGFSLFKSGLDDAQSLIFKADKEMYKIKKSKISKHSNK